MDEKTVSKATFYCAGHQQVEEGYGNYCRLWYMRKTSELKSEVHMLRKRELDRKIGEYRRIETERKQKETQ